jgi:hypothetical protein
MRKKLSLILVLLLMLSAAPFSPAQASPAIAPERLVSLIHNAPNTGIMLPAVFDPYEDTYLLTVASWVTRVTFTPVTASPTAIVTVNGQVVQSGQKSQIIQMTNEPQEVLITVSAYDGAQQLTGQTTYTVFMQRRPSERRTRVSAGYISNITIKDNAATISADLVTLAYTPNSNITTFINDTVYMYTYDCDPACLFYFGTLNNPVRANTAQAFINNYLSSGNNLYYLIYIEDKIVAVLPYAPG